MNSWKHCRLEMCVEVDAVQPAWHRLLLAVDGIVRVVDRQPLSKELQAAKSTDSGRLMHEHMKDGAHECVAQETEVAKGGG